MNYIGRKSLFTKSMSLVLIMTFIMAFVLIDFTPAHAGFVSSVFKSVKKAVSGVVKGVTGAIKGVVGGITKVVSGVTKKFGGLLKKVGEFAKTKLLPIIAKVAPIIGVVASIVAPYLAPAFASIVTAIGTGAKISENVEIGPGSLVGMGTFVHKSIKSGSFALGDPFKIINKEQVPEKIIDEWEVFKKKCNKGA
jgi:hypothetical protein